MAGSSALSGFSLLFSGAARPDPAALTHLLQVDPQAARTFAISYYPDPSEGWLELLSHGLTYELGGLAPAPGGEAPEVVHCYGFAPQAPVPQGEWIGLMPGRHLSGGQNLQPVVRSMAAIVLSLLALEGVRGVSWGPARTLLAPDYVRRAFGAWLEGGAFPALGLTALARDDSGAMLSEGLSFFTGQEVRIDPILAENPVAAGKIAIRLIHSLVGGWEVKTPVEITGPQGERLGVAPAANGRVLQVWRAH